MRARLEKVLAEDFGTLMARVEPLALGPPVDWPLQYRVSGPDVSGRARHRRDSGRHDAREFQYPRGEFRLERDDQAHAHRRRPGQGAPARRQLRAGVARADVGAVGPHRHAVPRRHLSDRRAGPRPGAAIAATSRACAISKIGIAQRQFRAARADRDFRVRPRGNRDLAPQPAAHHHRAVEGRRRPDGRDGDRAVAGAHRSADGQTTAGLSHRGRRRGGRERQGIGVHHGRDPGDVHHHAVHPHAAAAQHAEAAAGDAHGAAGHHRRDASRCW